MTASGHQRRHLLLLGPMAAETRRSLGPLAWAALEALVTDAQKSDGADVVNTSVRQLAAQLGVAKNTAHRALVALRNAGFVEPDQPRSTSGRFSTGAYRLVVAPSILRLTTEAASPSAAPRSVKRRAPRRAPSPSRQLSLLPSV